MTDLGTKKSQLASFSIQDILRVSTSDANGLPSPVAIENSVNGFQKKTDGKLTKRESAPKILETGTGKRIRTIFTQEQLDKLEANFERQQYMIRSERTQLAAALNLQEAQVKVWVSLQIF